VVASVEVEVEPFELEEPMCDAKVLVQV